MKPSRTIPQGTAFCYQKSGLMLLHQIYLLVCNLATKDKESEIKLPKLVLPFNYEHLGLGKYTGLKPRCFKIQR